MLERLLFQRFRDASHQRGFVVGGFKCFAALAPIGRAGFFRMGRQVGVRLGFTQKFRGVSAHVVEIDFA